MSQLSELLPCGTGMIFMISMIAMINSTIKNKKEKFRHCEGVSQGM
jgi:hypothetical protein